MADWTDPPWAELTAGKPWTDEKAAAAFENSIAIAEGAPDAPKISPLALDGTRLLPTATIITDLDDVKVLEFFLLTDFPNSSSFEVRFSANNGSSWGSYQTMLGPVIGGFSGNFRARFGRIDLRTGVFVVGTTAGTLTVLSSANALQFRVTGSAAAFELTPMIGGGNL